MNEKYISVSKFKQSLARLTVEGGDKIFAEAIARTLGEVVPKLLDDEPAADVQPVDRWISVRDRLPENDDEVFINEVDIGVIVGWYSAKNKQWRCEVCGNIEVTHWQPLPNPPSDSTKG